MARLPSGFHWINSRSKKEGATGPRGQRLTRQEAENRGANEVGLKNAYQYNRLSKDTASRLGDPANSSRGAVNYRAGLREARETAKRRGQRFDRGRFDATAASLSANRGNTEGFQRALSQYQFITGKTDRPEAGTGS